MILLIIFLVLLVLFLLCYIKSKNQYDEYMELVDDKTPFKKFIPVGLYILDITKHKFNSLYDRKLLSKFQQLYHINHLKHLKIHLGMVFSVLIFIAMAGTFLGGVVQIQNSSNDNEKIELVDGNTLVRPKIREAGKTVELEAKISKGDIEEDGKIVVDLEPEYYDVEGAVKRAKELFTDDLILGSNKDLQSVSQKLNLYTRFKGLDKNKMVIKWISDNKEIISVDGQVSPPDLGEGNKNVKLTLNFIDLENDSVVWSKEYDVVVLEKEPLTDEQLVKKAKEELEVHIANNDKNLILPNKIENKEEVNVTWKVVKKEKKDNTLFVILGIIIFCILIFYLLNGDVDKKIKEKEMMIQYDFPEFINKLVLLINAGMTVSRAWNKIVQDQESNKPLYKELQLVSREIKNGKAEVEAYEDFALRCKVPEINRFVSCIVQNLRKGNAELAVILRLQAKDCWEMRKNIAKRLGERASTKLLLPMVIMLIAILLIVFVPATMQLQGM